MMPFVTEELWSRVPGGREVLMRTEWPDLAGRFGDPGAEEEFDQVMGIVEHVGGRRQAAGAPPRGGSLHLDRAVSDTVAGLVARLAHVGLVDVMDARGTPLAIVGGRVSFPAGTGDAPRGEG